MGSGCGKAHSTMEPGPGPSGVTGPSSGADILQDDNYFVQLQCFSTSVANILAPKPAIAKGCKNVAVTKIIVEDRRTAKGPGRPLKKLNSVLNMPIVRWAGINMKAQVPKLLPMNLWTGTYLLFGFYEKQDREMNCYVTLDGNIGTKQMQLQQTINSDTSLTSADWDNLKATLQVEEDKIKALNPPVPGLKQEDEKPSRRVSDQHERHLSSVRDSQREHRDIRSSVRDSVRELRDSQDTGYTSHGVSSVQSPYSPLLYSEQSTESDGDVPRAKEREAQSNDKKHRMRRKDTPSHHQMGAAIKQTSGLVIYKRKVEENPLKEESESNRSSDGSATKRGSTNDGNSDTELLIKASTTPKIMRSFSPPFKISRSYQSLLNITEPDRPRQEELTSPVSLGGSSHRRKKRSLVTKLTSSYKEDADLISFKALPTMKIALSENDADADDERDITAEPSINLHDTEESNFIDKPLHDITSETQTSTVIDEANVPSSLREKRVSFNKAKESQQRKADSKSERSKDNEPRLKHSAPIKDSRISGSQMERNRSKQKPNLNVKKSKTDDSVILKHQSNVEKVHFEETHDKSSSSDFGETEKRAHAQSISCENKPKGVLIAIRRKYQSLEGTEKKIVLPTTEAQDKKPDPIEAFTDGIDTSNDTSDGQADTVAVNNDETSNS